MHPVTLLAMAVAFLASMLACRRRWIRVLGKGGRDLAPGFLLIVWFVGLGLGQVTGSLAGMAWATLPALMKVRLKIDEVVSTLLLNYVAIFFVSAIGERSREHFHDRADDAAPVCHFASSAAAAEVAVGAASGATGSGVR